MDPKLIGLSQFLLGLNAFLNHYHDDASAGNDHLEAARLRLLPFSPHRLTPQLKVLKHHTHSTHHSRGQIAAQPRKPRNDVSICLHKWIYIS